MNEKQYENENLKTFVLKQKLASGADLRILIFGGGEIKLTFKYKYEQRPTPRAKRTLINETMLKVGYVDGFLSGCLLSMNIIVPPLLGKKFFLGTDISPGAKTYIEIEYVFKEGALRAKTVHIGVRKIDLDTNKSEDIERFRHLIPAQFPLQGILPLDCEDGYVFRMWFLHESGKIHSFEFKKCVLKNLM